MSCPGYLPPFDPGQLDGSAFAGSNCNTWSAARSATYDSCGKDRPSSAQVRVWTGDTSGGTNLAEVDLALRDHLGIDLDTRYRYPWSDFVRRVNGGASAILQGWYAPIRASRFSGSETFGTNHSMLVAPGLVTLDPLADGRRPGIYKYHGEAYPEALLRRFAAELNIGAGRYVPLGDGLVYASFTRDNEPNYEVVIHPIPPAARRAYNTWTVSGSTIVSRDVAHTGGFSARCSAPRLYRWPGHSSQSLVRILTGSHAGQIVRAAYAHEV